MASRQWPHGDGLTAGASFEAAAGADSAAAHPVFHREAVPAGGLHLAHRDGAGPPGDHQPVRRREHGPRLSSADGGHAALLAKDNQRRDEDKLQELYFRVYSRPATQNQIAAGLAYLAKHGEKKQAAYEDILWALINTKEFLFNH